MDQNEVLMTPGQVAVMFQVSTGTVTRLLRTGRLPGVRLGRQWRIRKEELNDYLGAGASPAPGEVLDVCRDASGVYSVDACPVEPSEKP